MLYIVYCVFGFFCFFAFFEGGGGVGVKCFCKGLLTCLL